MVKFFELKSNIDRKITNLVPLTIEGLNLSKIISLHGKRYFYMKEYSKFEVDDLLFFHSLI